VVLCSRATEVQRANERTVDIDEGVAAAPQLVSSKESGKDSLAMRAIKYQPQRLVKCAQQERALGHFLGGALHCANESAAARIDCHVIKRVFPGEGALNRSDVPVAGIYAASVAMGFARVLIRRDHPAVVVLLVACENRVVVGKPISIGGMQFGNLT